MMPTGRPISTSEYRRINISRYREHRKGPLVAYMSLDLPSGMTIHDVGYFQKDGKRWIGLPSKDREVEGKRKFFPIVEFRDHAMNERFTTLVLAAVDAYIKGRHTGARAGGVT